MIQNVQSFDQPLSPHHLRGPSAYHHSPLGHRSRNLIHSFNHSPHPRSICLRKARNRAHNPHAPQPPHIFLHHQHPLLTIHHSPTRLQHHNRHNYQAQQPPARRHHGALPAPPAPQQ